MDNTELDYSYMLTTNISYDTFHNYNTTASLLNLTAESRLRFSVDLVSFNRWYQSIHGYLSIVVCSFGILSNVINIIVLTRKSMITPTNFLLTAIAVTDMLKMTSYWPFAAYFYCYSVMDANYNHRREWIVYMIFNINFVITCHTITMWLTVALAVFRYVAVCKPQIGKTFCTIQKARIVVTGIIIATIIVCLPIYVIYRPVRYPDDNTTSSMTSQTSQPVQAAAVTVTAAAQTLFTYSPMETICDPLFHLLGCNSLTNSRQNISNRSNSVVCSNITHISTQSSILDSSTQSQEFYWVMRNSFVNDRYLSFNFWSYGVVLKVVPCVLLSVLSLNLLMALREAGQKRKQLRRRRSSLRRRESDRMMDGDHSRTTTMLVAVVLSFVAAELPHGVVALLSGIHDDIFEKVYVPLGDVWDILVLLNSAINFILYCIMSRQYRQTFEKVFMSRWKRVQAYQHGVVEELALQVGVGKSYTVRVLAARTSLKRKKVGNFV